MTSLIDLYSLIVLATVLMSWLPVDPRSQPATMLRAVTEPVLEPIRRVVPPIAGLDLSPMVLLFALQLLKNFFR